MNPFPGEIEGLVNAPRLRNSSHRAAGGYSTSFLSGANGGPVPVPNPNMPNGPTDGFNWGLVLSWGTPFYNFPANPGVFNPNNALSNMWSATSQAPVGNNSAVQNQTTTVTWTKGTISATLFVKFTWNYGSVTGNNSQAWFVNVNGTVFGVNGAAVMGPNTSGVTTFSYPFTVSNGQTFFAFTRAYNGFSSFSLIQCHIG